MGLISVSVLAAPVFAMESTVQENAEPTCSRSLIQQSAVQASPADAASSTPALPPALKEAAKADSGHSLPPAIKVAAGVSSSQAAGPPEITKMIEHVAAQSAHTGADQDAHAGVSKMVEHVGVQSAPKSTSAEQDSAAKKKTEAHAMAKSLVEFAIPAWEVLVVFQLVVAVFVMLCGYGAYEYRQDPRNLGIRDAGYKPPHAFTQETRQQYRS